MATPSLTTHELGGVLGPIAVDVRAAARTAARPAVVVVHGFKGFKDWGMFPRFAERLARAGCTAVTYNGSGSGVDAGGAFAHPGRFARNTYGAELADLGVVLGALAAGALGVAPPSSVGLVGHSRGGGVAILRTAQDPRIGALVTWAAIDSVERWTREEAAAWRAEGQRPVVNARTGEVLWQHTDLLDEVERDATGPLDILAHAAHVEVPWLVAHGTADETVPFAEAQALVTRSAKATTRLCPVAGAGHTFGAVHPFAGMTPALAQVFDESVAWLTKRLT